jgi:AmmeMemoRadiSam system protein B
MNERSRTRQSIIAGSWYPGAAAELGRTLDEYLAAAPKSDLPSPPIGLIAPHAGYVYSGGVAAHSYKQVQGEAYDCVVVLSPVHRLPMGRYAITEYSSYQTPLGDVALDEELVRELDRRLPINRVGFDNEHSLEIQLPFLQRVLGDFRLLPIMMGVQDPRSCRALADALGELLRGTRTLLVASTDLAHLPSLHGTQTSDEVFLRDFAAYDVEGLERDLASGATAACGGGPVVTVMLAARELGATNARILKHATSYDVTGDESYVVGYAAGILTADV